MQEIVINSIVAKHPTWKRIHRRHIIDHNDATSQTDWTGELEVNDNELCIECESIIL